MSLSLALNASPKIGLWKKKIRTFVPGELGKRRGCKKGPWGNLFALCGSLTLKISGKNAEITKGESSWKTFLEKRISYGGARKTTSPGTGIRSFNYQQSGREDSTEWA